MLGFKAKVDGVKLVRDRPEKFNRGLVKGVDKAADSALEVKEEEIQDPTYVTPERRSKTGRPLWKRKGNWLSKQAIRKTGLWSRAVETFGQARKPITNYEGGYEEKNATLPTSPDGKDRANAAAEKTLPKIEAPVQAAIAQSIYDELNS